MPTRAELEQALTAAHAAGNADHARILADALAKEVAPPPNPGAIALEGTSPMERFAIGMGKGFTDLGRGAKQLFNIGDQDKLKADIEESRKIDAPLMDSTAGWMGNLAGNIAGTLPIAMTTGPTVLGGMAAGTAAGALSPSLSNEEAVASALTGAAGGGIGSAVGKLLARPIGSSLSPQGNALAQAATQKYDIPLNAAQLTGSKPLKWINSAFADMPLTAGRQAAINEAQQNAFNRAVGRQFDAPVNADKLTPEVMGEAKRQIGQKFTDLSARNRLFLDPEAFQGITQLQFNANRYDTADVNRIIGNYIQDLWQKVEPDGTISGEAYRKFDSALGRRMRGSSNGDLAYALGELRDVVRNAMDRSISAADRDSWHEARRQYMALQKVAPLVAKNAEGNVPPNQLLNASLRGNKSAAFTGGGDLGELGRIGKEFLTDMPSSGTAQRTFWMNFPWSMASYGFGGGLGVPVQALMNSRAGTRYLSGQMIPDGLLGRIRALGAASGAGLLNSPETNLLE